MPLLGPGLSVCENSSGMNTERIGRPGAGPGNSEFFRFNLVDYGLCQGEVQGNIDKDKVDKLGYHQDFNQTEQPCFYHFFNPPVSGQDACLQETRKAV